MGSLDSYLPIFFMLVLGIAFASLSFIASKMLAPQRPTSAKEAPYECGIVPTHEPARRFPVRFYLVAMIFVIVDIEIIFLFPWAVDAQRAWADSAWSRSSSSPPRCSSPLVYLVAQRRPRLGPDEAGPPDASRSPAAPSSSTVRRVGPSSGEAA